MSFDALALHAVRDEAEQAVAHGRVDAVMLLDDRTVCLEVYAGRRVFVVISANPSDQRVYLTQERPQRGTDAVTPFLLLLRKYVRGGRILAIEQPRLERLLLIQLSARLDDGTVRHVDLIAELMGRRSNIVLVDEDSTILDALVRLPPSVNPSRPLLPHLRYRPPTAEGKVDPMDRALPGMLRGRAADFEGEAWRLVMSRAAGFSPLASQEVVARASGSPQTPASSIADWEAVGDAIQQLALPIDSHDWRPSIAWDGESVIEFAPYHLEQFPEASVRHYDSMSEVLALVAGPKRAIRATAFATLRRPLTDGITQRIEQLHRKRSSLERSLAMSDRADSLRAAGEAILANIASIHEGDTSLTWEGRRIDLYPSLSPSENAQGYFRQYADARDAKKVVPPLLEEVEGELAYLDDMALYVESSESESEINGIRRELEETGILHRQTPKKAKTTSAKDRPAAAGVVRRLSIEGADILLGASAAGNEAVTFKHARPNDLWFHARGRPGAHVILRVEGRTIRNEWIPLCAGIAAANSAGHEQGKIEVDYTPRKFVRKIAGALPGRVTYRNETTLSVEPFDVRGADRRKTG